MLLKLIQTGDETLRKLAKPVTKAQLASAKIQTLIDLMIDTLHDAPGVGIAAPQVDESLQIIVTHDKKSYHKQLPAELVKEQQRKAIPVTVLVNPKLEIIDAEELRYFEGCLSVDGYVGVVARANKVRVTGWDRHGKAIIINATGWNARILQHEIDHLAGVLYIDTVNPKSFMSQKNFSLQWRTALAKDIASKFK